MSHPHHIHSVHNVHNECTAQIKEEREKEKVKESDLKNENMEEGEVIFLHIYEKCT